MTLKRDCDQSEHVFLKNIPYLLVNTEFFNFSLKSSFGLLESVSFINATR